MTTWLCRAGKLGEYEQKFIEDRRIYCTWDNLPRSIASFEARDDLHRFFTDQGDVKDKTATNWVSQVWPFCHEMRIDDWVLLPSKVAPVIHVGRITGGYVFDEQGRMPFQHYHDVDWFAKDIPRTAFEQDILYSLGAFMTICRIKQQDRIKAIVNRCLANGVESPCQDSGNDEVIEQRDIEIDAFDEIKNMIIQKYKGHGLAKVVAAILKAKGYVTYVSPEGTDRGVDILASRGALGFDGHKMCIQVKSTDSPVDRPTLDQLIGTMSNFKADYGLLVSWGGFKNSVINETANQFFKVRLWNHIDIVNEFLENYETLDDDIKAEIPLKKIWMINAKNN